jgi:hypothetical protein
MRQIGRAARGIPRRLVDIVKQYPFDLGERFKGASLSFRRRERQ